MSPVTPPAPTPESELPEAVIAAFDLEPGSIARAPSGLINRTWFATSRPAGRCVVQRVNPIFPPPTLHDIDAVTRRLAASGLVTPRLVPTRAGALWCAADGGVWRALTRIDGVSFDAIERPEQAREAGRMLGVFHAALDGIEHEFTRARPQVHDLDRHVADLRAALAESRGHRHYDAISALADEVLTLAAAVEPLADPPARVVHGDPKISNVLFDAADGRAICLIDLDTVARQPAIFEIGDALRSWCNPAPEDAPDPRFALDTCAAALAGYVEGSGGLIPEREWRTFAGAAYRIAVELAARFCRDALLESYFGWDASRYASASDHNQARTASQARLARRIAAEADTVRAAVEDAFGAR